LSFAIVSAAFITQNRESLLKGKDQYGRPSCNY
jgi:hypothetical protein